MLALTLFLAAAILNAPAGSAEAKTLKWSCSYPVIANPGGVFKDRSLAFTFSLDDTGKQATVTGSHGTHAVEAFAGSEGLTFIERFKTGAINVTTIDSSGKSVHSQHTMLKGLLIPSQAYGKCAAE